MIKNVRGASMKILSINNDKKFDLDPHFYVRQKELHKLRNAIKNGKMEMLSEEQYNQEITQFFCTLENKPSKTQ